MSIVDSARKALVPIHREGYPFIAIAAVATVILAMIWSPLGWIGATPDGLGLLFLPRSATGDADPRRPPWSRQLMAR